MKRLGLSPQEEGVTLNVMSSDGDRIYQACHDGDIAALQRILDEISTDDFRDDSAGAFCTAAMNGHVGAMKLILTHGRETGSPVDIHGNGELAFDFAAKNGHVDAMKLLLTHGIETNSPVDIHATNENAFCWAARNGHVGVMKFLLAHGIETNSPVDIHADDEWAFRVATINGHVDAIEILLTECAVNAFLESDQLSGIVFGMRRTSPAIVEILTTKFKVDIPPDTLEKWNIPVADLSIPCLLSFADKQTPFGVACAAQLDLIFESHSQRLGIAADAANGLYESAMPHMSCLRHSAFPPNIADTVLARLAPPGWDDLVCRMSKRDDL